MESGAGPGTMGSGKDVAALLRVNSRASFVSNSSRGSKKSRMAGLRDRRKFNLVEVIERVFELLVGEYGHKNQLEIPVCFYQVYNGSLMRRFLAGVVLYFYAYIKVLRLYQQQLSEDQLLPQLNLARAGPARPVFDADADFLKARQEQKERLEQLAQTYARLVLACSNFEQSQNDKLFFECTFHFAFLVVKSCVDPKPFEAKILWTRVQGELCYVFRGPHFDIARRAALKQEALDRARDVQALGNLGLIDDADGDAGADGGVGGVGIGIGIGIGIGVGGPAHIASEGAGGGGLSGVAPRKPSVPGPPGGGSFRMHKQASMRSVAASTADASEKGDGGAPPQECACPDNTFVGIASIRAAAAADDLCGADDDGAVGDGSGAVSGAGWDVFGGQLQLQQRRERHAFSVHKAVHARSPMLALLFPPAEEQAKRNANNALARVLATKKEAKRRKAEKRRNEAAERDRAARARRLGVRPIDPNGVVGLETDRLLRLLTHSV